MLDEIFCLRPNNPLYHYTDQKGFIGILSTKEIWLTHNQYLNDKQEFHYAIALLKDEIQETKGKLENAADQFIIEMMLDGLSEIHMTNVMVCSFSEDQDSLSQWRAYANKAGVAIGFSSDHLASIAEKSGVKLAKCLYEEKDQRSLIKKVLSFVFSGYKNKKYEVYENVDLNLPNQVIPPMLRIAPIIKHPAFKEEKEWRLISLTPCTSDRFHYRPSQSFIIPYYRLNLLNENLELPLEKIIIGPTSDPELAKKSVESFLVKETKNKNGKIVSVSKPENFLGHTNFPIEVSKIPYRNW